MKQFIILILISAMALVFTQCSVKPSKRTHNNAVGIWVGTSDLPDRNDEDYKIQSWAVGVNIKHLNPKVLCNSFFNANSGIHFGKSYGISVDASAGLSTDELYRKEFWLDGTVPAGTQAFQFYAGPSLGANLLMSKKGKLRFNPTIGASGGMSMLFDPYRKYPESDLSFEGVLHANIKDLILKPIRGEKVEPGYGMGRVLYDLYLF